LTANSSTPPGTYKPTITVSTSGQSASLGFTLVIEAPAKTASPGDSALNQCPVRISLKRGSQSTSSAI
jgi:hypothetical protein